MPGLLAIIVVLISQASQRTYWSVSWRMIALMVASGAERVQAMPANTVAKYVMSYFGIEIYINKIAVNNQQRNR